MYSCWVDTMFGLESWDGSGNVEGLLSFILIIGLLIHFGLYENRRHKKEIAGQKAAAENVDELLSYQFTLIQFTRDKIVTPVAVRLLDSETRKLYNEMGGSNELYDENQESMMLELGLDTSWWKE